MSARPLAVTHTDVIDPRDAPIDERIDALELAMLETGLAVDLPVVHRFTPGMYSRELRAPAGVLATTYIHLIEHQFVLIQGSVSIYLDDRWQRIEAPYHGITKVGTRRIVYVHKDAIWTTFHPTDKTTVDEVEDEIFGIRTLPDGSNVHDRYLAALQSRLEEPSRGALTGASPSEEDE